MILCGNIGLINDEGVEHTVIVDGTNLRFSPDSLTINEGDSVRFLWDGELLPHNSVEENGVFDSGDPEREVDYLYTFNYEQSGIYNFFCEPHESVGMDGSITVLDKIEQQDNNVLSTSSEENKILPMIIFSGILFLGLVIFYRTRISQIEEL